MNYDWLDRAERHLSAGHQRRAFKEFEMAAYNTTSVRGGMQEVLARGRQMRPKVAGGYETKWDTHLARMEATVAQSSIERPVTQPPDPAPGRTRLPAADPSAELRRIGTSAVLAAASAPPTRMESKTNPVSSTAMKACPDCAEDVREQARKCRYCGYEFSKTCPECAEDVRAQARKCRHCGFRFAPLEGDAEAREDAATVGANESDQSNHKES